MFYTCEPEKHQWLTCEAKRKNGWDKADTASPLWLNHRDESTISFIQREKERIHGFTKNREGEVFTYWRDGERHHRETVSRGLRQIWNTMTRVKLDKPKRETQIHTWPKNESKRERDLWAQEDLLGYLASEKREKGERVDERRVREDKKNEIRVFFY